MKFWKIAPGRGANYWKESLRQELISINWLCKRDYRSFRNKKELTQTLERTGEGGTGGADSIWKFTYDIQPGDIVVANKGLSAVKGIGIVVSEYLCPWDKCNPNRKQDFHNHVRLVDWKLGNEEDAVKVDNRLFNQPAVQELSELQCQRIEHAYLKQNPKYTRLLNNLFHTRTRLLDGTGAPNDEPHIPHGSDDRDFAERTIALRRGQQSFREAICRRYHYSCIVTGCNLLDVLEAAHIQPYRGTQDNKPSNGLLLRADIHTLFDLKLLAINPDTLRVELHPKIADTKDYKGLNGKKLSCTKDRVPSIACLRLKYKEFRDAIAESRE